MEGTFYLNHPFYLDVFARTQQAKGSAIHCGTGKINVPYSMFILTRLIQIFPSASMNLSAC